MHRSWGEVKAGLVLFVVVVAAGCQWFMAWAYPGEDPIAQAAQWAADVQVHNPVSELIGSGKELRAQMDQQTAQLDRAAQDLEGFALSANE